MDLLWYIHFILDNKMIRKLILETKSQYEKNLLAFLLITLYIIQEV